MTPNQTDKLLKQLEQLTEVLRFGLTSPNELDSNWELPGVVDGLYYVARSIGSLTEQAKRIADALEDEGR